MPFATINGHSLHFMDIAPAAASSASAKTPTTATQQTIVFVHGLGSTQNYYFPILHYLTSYRCIVFDNYGAGRSNYLPGTETSIQSIAADVLGLLDHLQVDERVVVVGYSMGGMVPTYLASTSPDRVLACICIGPVHPSETVANVFKQRIPVVSQGGMETMANVIPNGATGAATTALQKAFIRELILAQDPEGYIANCRAIERATPPDYRRVRCPVLVVAGDQDKSSPVDACETIFRQLGTTPPERKRLEVLEGVGHWYCVEAPDQVGLLVSGFCHEVFGSHSHI